MKVIAFLAALAAVAGAQTPDVGTIMERVGRNQAQAVDQRKEFTFHQKQILRMHRGNGKVAREEHREYDVTPATHGVKKELAHFDGRYEHKGKYVTYDRPGYNYKDMDIDGDLIDDLSSDLTDDNRSRDGISANLFPLTTAQQSKYNFKLLGAEQYRGRQVYRVAYEPKKNQEEGAAWKGEALIDAAEFQPVSVHSTLALHIPGAVKILLGTNIKGLGFNVTYQKFEDGVWFPVSYGGEFEVRAVFFYKRTISVNMTNMEFRRSKVDSSVTYLANEKVIGLTAVRQALDFGELMREHRAMVFSVLWHFLHDRDLAEELAQDVFLSLHKNLSSIETSAHAGFWLRKVAVQRAIDAARKRSRRPQVSLEEVAEPSVRPVAGDPMLGGMLRRLIATLPEGPRMAMILRYQEDMDPTEIAETMGIPLGTVKSHIQRSLGLLREKLERRGVGER